MLLISAPVVVLYNCLKGNVLFQFIQHKVALDAALLPTTTEFHSAAV